MNVAKKNMHKPRKVFNEHVFRCFIVICSVNADEYAQLLGNFLEVVETHEELLTAMENSNDRIGKLFLSKAATMKCIHQAYCAAHPRAIVILDKHSEQLEAYMERQGAASPGLLVLTTGKSIHFSSKRLVIINENSFYRFVKTIPSTG